MDLRFEDKPVDASRIVIMNADESIDLKRAQLGFVDIVRQSFAFLAVLGFSETEALPTIVRYRKGGLALNVYHGRQSYEIGLEVGHTDELFSMEAIIRLTDPVVAEELRNPVATTSGALAAGIEHLADLLRRYGERALQDDPEFFADLRRQRQVCAEILELDVLERQIRPKAATAFQQGRYGEAAELYEKIAARLSAAERAKLAAARKRMRCP